MHEVPLNHLLIYLLLALSMPLFCKIGLVSLLAVIHQISLPAIMNLRYIVVKKRG